MRSFVLGFCVLIASVAMAQDFDAAAKHFGAAQAAFGQQHFKIAAGEFQAAFDVTHDPILLYNIAESWEKAGDGHKAYATYKLYLKAQPNAGDKTEVNRRLKALEAKKFKVASQSAPGDNPAAVVAAPAPPPAPMPEVTPQPTPTTPPAAVAPEAPPISATPAAPVAPEPAPEPARVETPPPPAVPVGVVEDRPSSKLRIAAWVGVASTVAVLTAGAIFGLAAQSRADEIDRQLNFVDASGAPKKFDQATQDNLTNLRSDGNLYNGLAIGFFSAAGALAITTTVLFVLDWRQHKETRTAGLKIVPTVGKDGAGLAARVELLMRRLVLTLALVSFAGCFDPDEPVCAFSCGDNNLCPDDYQCLPDGFCHLHGQAGDCKFPDASVTVVDMAGSGTDDGGDLSMAPDLTPGPNLAGFSQFAKCDLPSAYLTEATGVTLNFGNSDGLSYSVPCAQLSLAGGTVTVNWAPASGGTEDFTTHPLTPSTLGSSGNPIPHTTSGAGPATAVFTAPGFYPYFCGVHGSNDTTGMAGVVWITP